MNNKRVLQVIIIILVIVCAGLGYYSISTYNNLHITQITLLDTQNQLTLTEGSLLSTQNQLTSTQENLTQTQGQLAITNTQLTTTYNQLNLSQSQLTSTCNQLATAQTQLTQTQSQLTDANNKLSAITGLPSPIINIGTYLSGYKMVDGESRDIVLIGNPNATNTTYAELITFLLNDNTHEQVYSYPSFVCSNFAEMLYFHAEKAGINAGYVNLELSSYISSYTSGCGYSAGGFHACNVFNTTDRGLIFIDDTGTEEGDSEQTTVDVSIGQLYQPISIFSNTDWCPMGYIQNYNIVW